MVHLPVRLAISGAALAAALLSGCANVSTGVGISIPVGPFGSIGVSVGSGGRVGASVGVGVGGVGVSVGTSGQLPPAQNTVPATETAPVSSAPAEPAVKNEEPKKP